MTSRKLRPSLTCRADLGPVMPIEVPRPPLSLTMATERSAGQRGVVVDVVGDVLERGHVGQGVDRVLGDHPAGAGGDDLLELRVARLEGPHRELVLTVVPHPGRRVGQALSTHGPTLRWWARRARGAVDDVPARKAARRRRRRARRGRALAAATRPRRRRRAAGRCTSWPGGRAHRGDRVCRVAAYASYGVEPPTDRLVGPAARGGVRGRPARAAARPVLDWEVAGGASGPLGRGRLAGAAVVVTPALAVDRAGHRLGQGGGSYDRALARRPRTRSSSRCCTTASCSSTGPVPARSHDVRRCADAGVSAG